MTLRKRIVNLWKWSGIDPAEFDSFDPAKLRGVMGSDSKNISQSILERNMAQIIKRKPKDIIEELNEN